MENFKIEGPEETAKVSWEANRENLKNADSYEVSVTRTDGENITLSVKEPWVRFEEPLQQDSLVSVVAIVEGSEVWKSQPREALFITLDGRTLISIHPKAIGTPSWKRSGRHDESH